MPHRLKMAAIPVVAFLLWIGMNASAWAHKVTLFAYVEGKTVYTESFFADGRPVENGAISVQDARKKTLMEGKTDAKGLFSFPVPKKEDLTIVLDAGMGHKSQFVLKASDMGD